LSKLNPLKFQHLFEFFINQSISSKDLQMLFRALLRRAPFHRTLARSRGGLNQVFTRISSGFANSFSFPKV
jgi:hypothetical protein